MTRRPDWRDFYGGATPWPQSAQPVHTSITDPLHIDWVPSKLFGTRGRVGMTSAPGKCNEYGTHGTHRRSMTADLACVQAAKIHTVVTLMEARELTANSMNSLQSDLLQLGIRWVHYPIQDLSIPSEIHQLCALIEELQGVLRSGKRVLVHCRGGHGRTGLFVACMLVDAGHPPDEAIAHVRSARKGTIHNQAQEDFVRLYADLWA